MKIKTPLMVAQFNLTEIQDVLDYFIKEHPDEKRKIASLRKAVKAFTRLVDDPDALQLWWDSISPEGQKMLFDTTD